MEKSFNFATSSLKINDKSTKGNETTNSTPDAAVDAKAELRGGDNLPLFPPEIQAQSDEILALGADKLNPYNPRTPEEGKRIQEISPRCSQTMDAYGKTTMGEQYEQRKKKDEEDFKEKVRQLEEQGVEVDERMKTEISIELIRQHIEGGT